MSCKCARRTDEYHGWACTVTDGACMFLTPNSKSCAEMYGEGPDAGTEQEGEPVEGLIDAGECGNCDAPVAIERRDGEEGYVCLNCGYQYWEPAEEEPDED